MKSKPPLKSDYLDNSDKCKIIQEVLIKACLYYIDKIKQNKYGPINMSYFARNTGVHSDISKASDMIEKLKSHVDAEALKPILKTIPVQSGNFYEASFKVILGRSLLEIINMGNPNNKILFNWNDPKLNNNQVNLAVSEINKWIDASILEGNYSQFMKTMALIPDNGKEYQG